MRTSDFSVWRRTILALIFLALSGSVCSRAQDVCAAPNLAMGPRAANIFNEQQEEYLGDAMAEHLQRNYRVATDEQLTAYIRQIANRLLKHMPATQLHLQFFLVDLSDANAFNTAGGRVYISPKIVALAKNEDELAGVLAHELGHLVVHQMALDMTRNMGQLLKVTQVTDRRDIFEKYHQMLVAAERKPDALHRNPKEEDDDQRVADRLALYALAGAGYSLDAFPDFFDRLVGNQGKTGSWLSDVFGSTNPDSKRLREMIKTGAVPEGCIERAPKAKEDTFKAWQTAVIDFSGWSSQEVIHDVLNKTKLDPPLRGEIRHLKFSRDGKYILAQDQGNIFVLTRQPLAPIFRIDAPDAARAQFSPDSNLVVFHNRHLRVETWSIAAEKRISAHELNVRQGCLQSNLSPDGKILACLQSDSRPELGNDLALFDVVSGQEIFRKVSFQVNSMEFDISQLLEFIFVLLNPTREFDSGMIFAQFTPDARYLLAGREGKNILIDLGAHHEVPVPKQLHKQLTGGYAFLGTDRIVALNEGNPAKSHLLAFPSGDVISELTLARVELATATRGDYVLLRPVHDYPVGVVDAAAGKNLLAFKRSALDVFDQVFVCEERDGELSLRDVHTLQQLALTPLAWGRLGALRAEAISPDWQWLAVSEKGRGAVWSLTNGARLYHIRGFEGAYFPNNHVLYADLPKLDKVPRSLYQIGLHSQQMSEKAAIPEEQSRQYGQFLVISKDSDKNGKQRKGGESLTMEIKDVTSNATLWSRSFSTRASSYTVDSRQQRLLFWWPVASTEAKEEMKHLPALRPMQSDRKAKAESDLLEVLDASTGKVLGALIAETGSNYDDLRDPQSSGDWVAVAEDHNRVVTYSLSTGNRAGNYFGHDPMLSAASGLMSLENESGHLTLYDLTSSEDLARWVFSSSISFREFSADGKRLFVLTSDQTAYVIDVSPYVRASVASNSG